MSGSLVPASVILPLMVRNCCADSGSVASSNKASASILFMFYLVFELLL